MHAARGNRIVVEIETDIDGLSRFHGNHKVRLEGVNRQRQKLFNFFVVGLCHRLRIVGWPATLAGDIVSPGKDLSIQVLDRGEGTSREERVPDVPHRPLNRTLFVTSCGLARARREVIVGSEFKQAWIESHRLAISCEDRGFQIVVKAVSRDPAEVLECEHVSAQKVLHRLIQRKTHEALPGVSQGQEKRGQRSMSPADLNMAEARPVHLCLFPCKRPSP